jgi:hypothetical protein
LGTSVLQLRVLPVLSPLLRRAESLRRTAGVRIRVVVGEASDRSVADLPEEPAQRSGLLLSFSRNGSWHRPSWRPTTSVSLSWCETKRRRRLDAVMQSGGAGGGQRALPGTVRRGSRARSAIPAPATKPTWRFSIALCLDPAGGIGSRRMAAGRQAGIPGPTIQRAACALPVPADCRPGRLRSARMAGGSASGEHGLVAKAAVTRGPSGTRKGSSAPISGCSSR